jgi:hypothetical protein
MPENEAGTVSTALAMSLLLMEHPDELKKLQRGGFIQPVGKDSWRLADLIRGFAKWARQNTDATTGDRLAQCWGLSKGRIAQLAAEGAFKPPGHGGHYNWFDACSGYVRHLRNEDRKTSRSAADGRIKDAKARDIETRTQQRLSRLIPLEVYEEMIDNIAGMVRSEFAGLAAASTRDLIMRRVIEREVNARLRRIAEHAMAQAIRLETSGGTDAAIGANGAGHLGGEQQDLPGISSGAGST